MNRVQTLLLFLLCISSMDAVATSPCQSAFQTFRKVAKFLEPHSSANPSHNIIHINSLQNRLHALNTHRRHQNITHSSEDIQHTWNDIVNEITQLQEWMDNHHTEEFSQSEDVKKLLTTFMLARRLTVIENQIKQLEDAIIGY